LPRRKQIQKWGAMMKIPVNFILSVATGLIVANCNNYGLLDKLQDPTGGSSTELFTNNYYIFVSSWTTAGDMSGITFSECATKTGMGKADCGCTIAAINNKLRKSSSSVFRAWLSVDATPGPNAQDAKCRVQGLGNTCTTTLPGPWYNTQGQIVANSYNDFTAATLTNAIRYDESGLDSGVNLVWTGTLSTGLTATSLDCGDWAEALGANTGQVGDRTQTGNSWTQSATRASNTAQRIYCVAAP
jgi:hypothetical protein